MSNTDGWLAFGVSVGRDHDTQKELRTQQATKKTGGSTGRLSFQPK